MGQPEEIGSNLNGNLDRVTNGESIKDSPWPTISNISDIQHQCGNWTLAGDAGLLGYLQDFSHQLISKTHEMEKTVDQLIHKTKVTSSRVNNTINDFLMLSNTQFIENRVYDEEIQSETPVQQGKQEEQKSKDQREAELIPQISKALALGLDVIDKAFDKVELQQDSDSEDEEGRTIHGEALLEPKDPYLHRPLPHIIGSEAFFSDDSVGLYDLISNEIESESESDHKEYESDQKSFSEESVEEALEFVQDNKQSIQQPMFKRELPKVPRYSESDSASSDLFGDEGEYISGAESEEYKEEKISNSIQTLSKNSEEVESETSKDLFNDDIFGLSKSEESSIFTKRVSIQDSLFDDGNFKENFAEISAGEDDEFLKKKNEEKSQVVNNKEIHEKVIEKKPNDLKHKQSIIAKDLDKLFQSGDDDDLFTPKKLLEKNKNKDLKIERTESNSLFDDEEEDKLFSEPISKPTATSITTANPDLFMENEDFEEPPIINKSLPSADIKSPTESKIDINNLFLEDSHDDLFGTFDTISTTKKSSPFDSLDSEVTSQKSINVDIPTPPKEKETEEKTKNNKANVFSLLDEDEEDDLFALPPKDTKNKTVTTETKTRRGSSLFEDDDLFGKESSDSPEVDLFAITPKTNTGSKKEILESQRKLSDSKTSPTLSPPKIPIGGVSLFGGIDLFGKGDEKFMPSQEKLINTEKVENIKESVVLTKKEEIQVIKTPEKISVSFDEPVDTSNTLVCAAKGRAKIQTRRRPPTRKGRQMTPSSSVDIPDSQPSADIPDSQPIEKKDDINISLSKSESDLSSKQPKEASLDMMKSPSTEEDDIFILNDSPLPEIFPSKETKNISVADNLFSNIEDNKSGNINDDIFGDDIFAPKSKSSNSRPFLSASTDDIFSDSAFSKDSNSLFSSSSKTQKSNKEPSFLYSDSPDDDIFAPQALAKSTAVVKKPSTTKTVKMESDIFDDPLFAFGSSSDKE